MAAPSVICGASVVIVSTYILINKKTRSLVMNVPYSWCGFAVIVILLVSSVIFRNWLGIAVSVLFFFIFVFAFFARSIINYRFFNDMINIIISLSILPAIIGAVQKYYILHFLIPSHINPRFEGRVYSIFANPNFYAYIINLVMIMIIYKLIILKKEKYRDKYRKLYYYSALALNFVALILTNCRSSIITLLVGVLIIMLFHKKFLISAMLLFIYLSYFLLIEVLPDIFPRMNMIYLDDSFSQRVSIWKNAIIGIKESPLIGQGPLAYLNRFKDKVHAHNLLLDILLNNGFAGLVLYALYFIKYLTKGISLLKNNFGKTVFIFLVSFLIITAIHGITDVPIMGVQTGLLFGVLLSGFGIKPESIENKE